MNILGLIILGIALAMDAVAVAGVNGAKHHKMPFNKALKIAYFFGFFQFIMPMIGWLIGTKLINLIDKVDHWLSFTLLTILGIKMIFESKQNIDEKQIDIHSTKTLLTQSIATSIDALIVGSTLAFLKVNILVASIIIGVVTFCLSLAGVYLGKKFGKKFESKAEIAGGLILIIIAIKILTSHLLSW